MTRKLMPIAGMNNVSSDDGLQQGGEVSKLFVRDALNVDISNTGRIALRKGAIQVSNTLFKNIWQSPLHKDVFATLERQIVKLNHNSWGEYEVLLDDIDTSTVCFDVVNNLVLICTLHKIYCFNGSSLQPLAINSPAPVMAVGNSEGGTLGSGEYVIAISYLRNGIESSLSENTKCYIELNDPIALTGSISLTLPMCLDLGITQVAVYVTTRNGSELKKFGVYPISTVQVVIDQVDRLGRAAQFSHLSPMPSGKFMKYWQGRLLTANKNILRFSQALAYHLHDERHDFVMMPQRITFILPVDGGIWVGQVTHVVFLTGTSPTDMTFQPKTSHAPVPNSAIEIDAETAGSSIAQGGGKTALWLAENGYVIGTSSGQIIELQAGVMQGIVAKSARSVSLGKRVTTIVS